MKYENLCMADPDLTSCSFVPCVVQDFRSTFPDSQRSIIAQHAAPCGERRSIR